MIKVRKKSINCLIDRWILSVDQINLSVLKPESSCVCVSEQLSCFLILRGENVCVSFVCKRVKVQGQIAACRFWRLTGNTASEGGRPDGEK